MNTGVGKVGSSPRTTATGAECTVTYQVYNLTADPVGLATQLHSIEAVARGAAECYWS
jgi:hypothetical protein